MCAGMLSQKGSHLRVMTRPPHKQAPKKVDARLLDHRTLFQKDDEPMPNPDVFSNSKQKRCVRALSPGFAGGVGCGRDGRGEVGD